MTRVVLLLPDHFKFRFYFQDYDAARHVSAATAAVALEPGLQVELTVEGLPSVALSITE